MRFADAINGIEGLRFVAGETPVLSGPGRKCLMEQRFISNHRLLEEKLRSLKTAVEILKGKEFEDSIGKIKMTLTEVRDISNTISRLKGRSTLDDAEFFEVKGLAMAAAGLKELIERTPLGNCAELAMPDTGDIVGILDPENTRNRHFHIYDAYSESLAAARARLRNLQSQAGYDEKESDSLTGECMMMEEEVRRSLTGTLAPFAGVLEKALAAAGEADLLIAKASLAVEYRLARPEITERQTAYSNLRFLPAEKALRDAGKEFQPVDITLTPGVTLITGANMGGKTITLKSLALAQAMAQFAFFVPADGAEIVPVGKIDLSLADGQSASGGLSSFGAEILRIDLILGEAAPDAAGNSAPAEAPRNLILIDEPARTTNPDEGRAIVNAIIHLLGRSESIAVITTHYSNIDAACRRLRVKGLREDIPTAVGSVGPGSLSECMDYSLVEDSGSDVAREALRIARLLGIAERFAEQIERNLSADNMIKQ